MFSQVCLSTVGGRGSASTQCHGAGRPLPSPGYGQQAGGTYPTGINLCLAVLLPTVQNIYTQISPHKGISNRLIARLCLISTWACLLYTLGHPLQRVS